MGDRVTFANSMRGEHIAPGGIAERRSLKSVSFGFIVTDLKPTPFQTAPALVVQPSAMVTPDFSFTDGVRNPDLSAASVPARPAVVSWPRPEGLQVSGRRRTF